MPVHYPLNQTAETMTHGRPLTAIAGLDPATHPRPSKRGVPGQARR